MYLVFLRTPTYVLCIIIVVIVKFQMHFYIITDGACVSVAED